MRRAWSPWVYLLSVCLVLSSAGCYTGRDYAEESAGLIEPGMTMSQVAGRLGDPDLVVRGDPGSDTEWIYRFEGGPNPVTVAFLVIFFVLLIVVLAASKGGGVGSFGGGGGGESPPYQIRIHFDKEGRVLEVSPPHPVPGLDQ
jgi:outer membrane protein assembly factor BamE (lipoprotein component of BamABCDE complex)